MSGDWGRLANVARGVARSSGASAADADDLAQDAVAALLECAPEGLTREQREAYVVTTVRRALGRLRVTEQRERTALDELQVRSVECGDIDEVIDRRRAIARLTPVGLSDARWLGVDPASRVWRSRARSALRGAALGQVEPPQGLSPRGGPPGSGAPTRRSGSHGKNFAG